MPTQASHGGKDDVVSPDQSRRLAAALEAAGARPQVTIFPAANHTAWDRAYRETGLPSWLLAHRRPTPWRPP